MSAFIICTITFDRFIVLRFPFSRVRLRHKSALAMIVVLWVTGMLIAALPFTPAFSFMKFYQQTGVCIPLPITRSNVQTYSFAVMIVLNFILFLFIAVGQVAIFITVNSHLLLSQSGRLWLLQTLSACVCVCVRLSVCLSNSVCIPLLRLISRLQWVRI